MIPGQHLDGTRKGSSQHASFSDEIGGWAAERKAIGPVRDRFALAARLEEPQELFEAAARRLSHCGDIMSFESCGHMGHPARLVNGGWCNVRFCPRCDKRRAVVNGRRIADRIRLALAENPNAFVAFVTLTVSNVTDAQGAWDAVQPHWRWLWHQRTTAQRSAHAAARRLLAPALGGVVCYETTYNAKDRTYHPHLHALLITTAPIPIRAKGDRPGLADVWCERTGAATWAQQVQGIKPREGDRHAQALSDAIAEVCKYPTKAAKLPEASPDAEGDPLTSLWLALRGKRLMQPFGCLLGLELSDADEGDGTELNDGENDGPNCPACGGMRLQHVAEWRGNTYRVAGADRRSVDPETGELTRGRVVDPPDAELRLCSEHRRAVEHARRAAVWRLHEDLSLPTLIARHTDHPRGIRFGMDVCDENGGDQ